LYVGLFFVQDPTLLLLCCYYVCGSDCCNVCWIVVVSDICPSHFNLMLLTILLYVLIFRKGEQTWTPTDVSWKSHYSAVGVRLLQQGIWV
jgi:hypothetical protein